MTPPDRRAQDLKAAAVGEGKAKHNAEQGCLPRPVRPDDPVDLAGRDIQVDTVERDDITEDFCELTSPNCTGTANISSSSHTANLQYTSDMCVDGH
ncbi:MAG TPA: hypothetical protein VHV09_24205 [Trebonia sp.]|jgi:hypothetical protein|nr:hypothetical protein [Trebonia sp.]